jgi:hypothetical protein
MYNNMSYIQNAIHAIELRGRSQIRCICRSAIVSDQVLVLGGAQKVKYLSNVVV